MNYPTLDEVADATAYQLGRWSRFLKSPGMSLLDLGESYTREQLEEVMAKEAEIMDAILIRFRALGGWTPELSKSIGWE